jgi:hypothetical protein
MGVEDDAALAQAAQAGHELGSDVVGPKPVDNYHQVRMRRRRLSTQTNCADGDRQSDPSRQRHAQAFHDLPVSGPRL